MQLHPPGTHIGGQEGRGMPSNRFGCRSGSLTGRVWPRKRNGHPRRCAYGPRGRARSAGGGVPTRSVGTREGGAT